MVLPSYSPQTTAVIVWAPVVAWCLLRAFADSLPRDLNLGEIFDRLYLRPALADTFHPLGLDGDAAYRAVARVRILLTRPHETESAPVPSSRAWDDPDIIWFTGLHQAQGHRYFNKEAHEQLLWWSALPDLIATAEKDRGAKSPATQKALQTFELEARAAIAAAERAGYRLDEMLKPAKPSLSRNLDLWTAGKADLATSVATPEPADDPANPPPRKRFTG